MKLSGNVKHEKHNEKTWSGFGTDPDHSLDLGIFSGIYCCMYKQYRKCQPLEDVCTLLLFLLLIIITSAKEVTFSPGFVCTSICLFVNKITQKLMDEF